MIEPEPLPAPPAPPQGEQTHPAHDGFAGGALTVAGIATAVVIAIWLAFYFFVFVPRAPAP